MRADRLLSILLLLQVGRRMTARELAERLEVSERTILRDMEALCAAGVPVTADRGTGGGWSLLQDYRTDLTGLSAEEAQTLFVARSSRLLADLGLGRAADAAFIKLTASLPAAARRNIEDTRKRLHIDGAGWFQSEEAFPYLATVQEAVWQERKIRMVYLKADGTPLDRIVDPLGLVAKGNIWYFVGATDGELRSYRISRIQEASVMDAPCVLPEDFDLAEFWERSVADLRASVPRYAATVRVQSGLLRKMRHDRYVRITREEPPAADGWTVLDVLCEGEDEAYDYVMRHGPQIEILDPLPLREKVKETVRIIASRY